MRAITKAVITEKSFRLTEAGQYSFVVHQTANKDEIAQEIKRLYKVDPISVNTITTPGKTKTRGRVIGRRSETKKAIVKLKPGQKISEFSVSES